MADKPVVFKLEASLDERTITGTSILLRDLFAAFALAGIIARGPEAQLKTAEDIRDGFVGCAYEFADAMLHVRQKESDGE